MTHDIFIREVNEELRQDRIRAGWKRFGPLLIGAAVLVVLATGGVVLWQRYERAQAAADGDRYLAAVDLATSGKTDEAIAALNALGGDGVGAYPDLARLRLAALRAKTDPAAAVASFDQVANDASAPAAIRDVAAVRAAYILVDTGSLDDVRARVERLSGDAEPLRYQAREILGMASWKSGAADDARRFFDGLSKDFGTPSGISRRARLMLDLIASGAAAPAADAPASEAAAIEAPAAASPKTPAAPEAPPAPITPEPAASAPAASPALSPAPQSVAP